MSLGGSELGSIDAELGNFELASIASSSSLTQAVSQMLVFTETTTPHDLHSANLSQTLTFTQTLVEFVDSVHSSQTLTFIQTNSITISHARSILQVLNITQTPEHSGSELSQSITHTLSFGQTITRIVDKSLLQSLNFITTINAFAAKGATQTLAFTQTAGVVKNQAYLINQTITFVNTLNLSRPLRVNQNLTLTQYPGIVAIVSQPCDSGTLGDIPLGVLTLGTDCYQNPSGVISQSLSIVDTTVLVKIFHKFVTQSLALNQSVTLGNFIRSIHLSQTLTFADNFYKKSIPVINGPPTLLTQPVVLVTIVRNNPKLFYNSLYSQYSSITLPPQQFDDSESTQNKINLYKTMSRRVFTYVQTIDRMLIKHEYLLDRRKSLELRNFLKANISEFLIFNTYDGKIYYGKIANNPLEFTSDRRFANAYEAVIVEIEFQGIRLHG